MGDQPAKWALDYCDGIMIIQTDVLVGGLVPRSVEELDNLGMLAEVTDGGQGLTGLDEPTLIIP